MPNRLGPINVRPITIDERIRFDAELDEHHWLGHVLIGRTMRYVALDEDGAWLALLGFGASALSCAPRDTFIGWSRELQYRRLIHIANNQRFCILPAGRQHNLASAVLARSLRRISNDYEERWGHPVLAVETFVDPSRHIGTCYLATNFTQLGLSAGYGRVSGHYVHHGNKKLCFIKLLRRDALSVLSAPFDSSALTTTKRSLMIDFGETTLDNKGGLLEHLSTIVDNRSARGIRHQLAPVLAIAAVATLSGARSLAAIGEFAAAAPQDVLSRLGQKYHKDKRRYIAPHDATIRRAIASVDADELDKVLGEWLYDQVRAGRITDDQLVFSVDGKSLRGARQQDGRAVHLFAAMVHGEGAVIAQREVDHKTNEIKALRPLLGDLDIAGTVVTADALHAQRDHAEFLVAEKQADYLLGVKENQPSLLKAIKATDPESFFPHYEEMSRGHGRIERRLTRSGPISEDILFPYAAQVVIVEREVHNLDGKLRSGETSYYITSLTRQKADTARLSAIVRGHWEIENRLHWVRDVTFDEDRSQVRKNSAPRVMAIFRNLAIASLRRAGETNIAKGLRSAGRDPGVSLKLLGL